MNHKLNLSCSTAALAELRSFLQQNLAIFKLSEVDRHQITLAVEEVCANLIIHSHACNPKEEIHLEVKELNKKIIDKIKKSLKQNERLAKIIVINYNPIPSILNLSIPAGTTTSTSSPITLPNKLLPIGDVTDILLNFKSASFSETI